MTREQFLDQLEQSFRGDNGEKWSVEVMTTARKKRFTHRAEDVEVFVDNALFDPACMVRVKGVEIPLEHSRARIAGAARNWHSRHCEREKAKRDALDRAEAAKSEDVLVGLGAL